MYGILLSNEERSALIKAIHLAQDTYAETADDLAGAPHEVDQQVGRETYKLVDVLEVVRKKLGDTWEPDPRFTAPDYPPEVK